MRMVPQVKLKNRRQFKYKSYKGIISSFIEQGNRYTQLIGQKVNGQTIKSVEFYFSRKPPKQVIQALNRIDIKVNWVK